MSGKPNQPACDRSRPLRPAVEASRLAPDAAGRRGHIARKCADALARALLCGALVAAAGCSHAPVSPLGWSKRPASFAITNPDATALGRLNARYAMDHPGESGFRLITTGREALRALMTLTRLAERSLDLQYYIWRTDRTGRMLLAAVLEAAERGVRVRLLLDDMDLEWEDRALERLDFHRNIEVRLFNPFASREFALADVLFDFDRITHRMHNKAFIADNSVAVVGGRNVGDQYFSANEAANYRDLDLYAAGPIVRQISASFDEFWNSAWAVPIGEITEESGAVASVPGLSEVVGHDSASADLFPSQSARKSPLRRIEDTYGRLIWTGDTTLLVDHANKPATDEPGLVREMRSALAGALQNEVLLEIAYLIPGDTGVAMLCRAVAAGITVRILTNSFASNDVITAHAAYRKFREPLLRCGVELYEMRADAAFVRTEWSWLKPSSSAYLHTKAAVLDGEYVLIGSFNMDPRSVSLNTEIALLVRDRRLAKAVTAFIETGMSPDNAWRLALEGGDIVWIGGRGADASRRDVEPGDAFWRSLFSRFISLLPIEGQL